MLHILKVLSGWPQPEHVSDLHILMLTVIGPLALGVVITALAFAPKLMKRTRQEAAAVGLGPSAEEIAAEQGHAHLGQGSARRAIDQA